MSILMDASILARLVNPADQAYQTAMVAVAELHRRNEVLHITPQNLIEFRSVATRSIGQNGLGLTTKQVENITNRFEQIFPLLTETPAIYPNWKALVAGFGIVGKQVHDARLVAVCHAHHVSALLTFNGSHFQRFANFGPGLTVLEPSKL